MLRFLVFCFCLVSLYGIAQQHKPNTLIMKNPGCETATFFDQQTTFTFDIFKGHTESLKSFFTSQKTIQSVELTYTAGDYQGFVLHFKSAPGLKAFKSLMASAGVVYLQRMHLSPEPTH
ncbi:MAG: hypothetical protein ACO259_05285 [Bacteroidia bacterium]|jgi:hypothetical protein|nr:hypothetical protein [Sphingobacteriia bacterium]